jgi:hypothetical protein
VRKEIADMSATEWSDYVRALNGLRTNGVYANYVSIHGNNAGLAHGGCYFLPWHREFLYRFERELNKIVPGVTVPFWDWTKVVSGRRINEAFANDPVWTTRMGGANGNGPIPNAPFSGWSAGGQTCRRDFFAGNGNVGGDGDSYTFASSEQLSTVATGSDSYADFVVFLEGQHNNPHVAIGQTMSFVGISPLDPMFWSHHSFIDKVWRDWQLAGSGNAFGGDWSDRPCSTSTSMTPFSISVTGILADTSQCTTYAGSSSAGPTARFGLADGEVSVRQASSAALSISSAAERRRHIATIAQKKQSQPTAYKEAVALGLRQIETMQRASRKFRMPEGQIAKAVALYRNLLLKEAVDVVNDTSIAGKSVQTIVAEGRTQAANVTSGGGSGSS